MSARICCCFGCIFTQNNRYEYRSLVNELWRRIDLELHSPVTILIATIRDNMQYATANWWSYEPIKLHLTDSIYCTKTWLLLVVSLQTFRYLPNAWLLSRLFFICLLPSHQWYWLSTKQNQILHSNAKWLPLQNFRSQQVTVEFWFEHCCCCYCKWNK